MKQKGTILLLCICLLAGLLAGCSTARVQSAQLQPQSLLLEQGEQQTLQASFAFADPEQAAEVLAAAAISWQSTDESVVTVDQTGLVTATGPGNATIVLSGVGSAFPVTVQVTVYAPLVQLALAPQHLLYLNEQAEPLVLEINGLTGGEALQFETDNQEVATVDETGLVTPIGPGSCTITVTATDAAGGSATATTLVHVGYRVEEIALGAESGTLRVGETYALRLAAQPEEAAPVYTFASSDERIATVDESGVVTAVAVGSATITVQEAGGLTLAYSLTVRAAATSTTTTSSQPPAGGGGGGETPPPPQDPDPTPDPDPGSSSSPDPDPSTPSTPDPGGNEGGGNEGGGDEGGGDGGGAEGGGEEGE